MLDGQYRVEDDAGNVHWIAQESDKYAEIQALISNGHPFDSEIYEAISIEDQRRARYEEECDPITVSIMRYQVLLASTEDTDKKAEIQSKLDAANQDLVARSLAIESALPYE